MKKYKNPAMAPPAIGPMRGIQKNHSVFDPGTPENATRPKRSDAKTRGAKSRTELNAPLPTKYLISKKVDPYK